MRAGYAARGVTYLILGTLACLAARSGAQAKGTSDAFAALRGEPWGLAMLWALAVGLMAFAVWRVIDGYMDLEEEGSGAKGLIARAGQIVTGLLHAGLGLTAARVALGLGGSSGGQGGDKAQSLTSWLITKPYGPQIVIAIGAITCAAGIYYFYKAWSEKYRSDLRASPVVEKLEPMIKAGLVAHGIVILMIGGFLIFAGLTANPEQAGAIGKAFETVRSQPYGQILLALLGLGLVAFGLFCWIEAIYRFVPRRVKPGTQSLATRINAKTARKAAERAAASADPRTT
tara:strand:+ start:46138 stop:46998 length:861 start_codon:yes stop_codon:yes gene_type:complete